MNKNTTHEDISSPSCYGLQNDNWMQTFICNQPVTKLRVASPAWGKLSVAIRTVVDSSTQTPTISCKNMQFRHQICQLTTNQTRVVTANSHTFCGEKYLAHSIRMWTFSHYNFYWLLRTCLYTWCQVQQLVTITISNFFCHAVTPILSTIISWQSTNESS